MTYLIDQLVLIGWNVINSRIDAYRILKHKAIAHGINFGAYVLMVGALFWLGRFEEKESILFGISAFFNRNIVFDSFLNKRRGLSIFYVSTAQPPKSWWDRVEISVFGRNGVLIFVIYMIGWVVTFLIKYIS